MGQEGRKCVYFTTGSLDPQSGVLVEERLFYFKGKNAEGSGKLKTKLAQSYTANKVNSYWKSLVKGF